MPGYFILVVLLALGFGVASAVRQRRRTNQAWAMAGEMLGLRFTPRDVITQRKLEGEIDGLGVVVATARGSGNDKGTTRFEVRFPRSLGLGLRVTREGLMSGMAKVLGAQDIEVGNATFDDQVSIKGADPAEVVAFLTPARRERLLRMFQARPQTRVEDSGITWVHPGTVRETGELVTQVRQLLDVGHCLVDEEDVAAPSGRVPPGRVAGHLLEVPSGERAQGDHGGWLARVEAAESLVPVIDVPPSEEAATLEAASVKAKSAKAKSAKAKSAKAKSAKAATVEATVTTPEPAGTIRPELPESAPAESLDARTFAEAVFDPQLMSFDSARLFEERYAGQRVRWTGELRAVGRFAFDMTLGARDGCKATFQLHEVAGASYAQNRVLAEVGLPPEAHDRLVGRKGERLTFEGVLLKVDGFMKRVVVGEARMV